jgi:hypothetical protein
MTRNSADNVRKLLDDIYRTESRRVLATLARLLGDFGLAEDAIHDAFSAALERWQEGGGPANPRAWLVSAGSLIPDSKVLIWGYLFSLNHRLQTLLLPRISKKFGIVKVTSSRIDIGIKLKVAGSTSRSRKAGDWNSMVTHRERISDIKQIDGELLKWLNQAYEKT